MNHFGFLDDESDGNENGGIQWWVVPFLVTLSITWGVLGFLGGAAEDTPGTRPEPVLVQRQPAFSKPAQAPPEPAKPQPVPAEPSAPPQAEDADTTASLTDSPSPAQLSALFAAAIAGELPQAPPEPAIAPPPALPELSGPPKATSAESAPPPDDTPAKLAQAPAAPTPPPASRPENPRKATQAAAPAGERPGLWPQNDPAFKNCVQAGNGIRLKWRSAEGSGTTYIMVKKHRGGEWKSWVEKTVAKGGEFTLTLKSADARNSEFQWGLFSGSSNAPAEWNYFCTRG